MLQLHFQNKYGNYYHANNIYIYIYIYIKVVNIGFNRYIGTWILWIYWKYIDGYFYMSIDILKINKNTLKFMKILCKNIKMILIIKYTH